VFGHDSDPMGERPVLLSYCFHLFVGFLPALLLGFIAEALLGPFYDKDGYLTVFAPGAAAIAFITGVIWNFVRRDSCASFVFLPPLLLFLVDWYGLTTTWSPDWSHESHGEYVIHNLLGPLPECGSGECLSTLPTAILICGVCYSLGALLGQLSKSRRQAVD